MPSVTITTFVEGQFSAAHLGPFGKQLHGHDWFVSVIFRSSDDPDDACDHRELLDASLALVDHKTLDDVLGVRAATNEGVAAWLFDRLRGEGCVRVEVWRYERCRRFGAAAE